MASTPADLVITPRNIAFGRGQQHERWWMNSDPVATAFHNAMSATFPQGESFFVESVKRFRDEVPEPLKSQIADFVRQEVLHTREHVAFNRQATDAGYDLSAIEAQVRERLALVRSRHPVAQLAVTVALEHFTAIFAHRLLSEANALAGAPDEARRMWLWHAIEEVEHKGVAFDTYMHVTRGLKPLRRWFIRSAVFLNVSRNFAKQRTRNTLDLLAQDGITGARAWAMVLWFMFGKPGVLRRVFPAWVAFLRPGFHPWDHDDRHLIRAAEAELRADERAAA
jgi:predicted metal-dependent hydrolase